MKTTLSRLNERKPFNFTPKPSRNRAPDPARRTFGPKNAIVEGLHSASLQAQLAAALAAPTRYVAVRHISKHIAPPKQ